MRVVMKGCQQVACWVDKTDVSKGDLLAATKEAKMDVELENFLADEWVE